MKKRLMAMLLACAVVLSVAGCNQQPADGDKTDATTPKPDTTPAVGDTTTAEPVKPTFGEQGKVFNIYVWNTEYKEFFEIYIEGTRPINHAAITAAETAKEEDATVEIPAAVMYDKAIGVPEGVTINWVSNPSDGGVYQQKLDEALQAQATAPADEKIDMFLAEADYIKKYVDSSATMDIAELGLSQLPTMYQYTVDAATDSNGKTKGVSFQCCPAALIYRRSIAQDVLGTDDPAEVQKQLDSWAKFDEVAAKAKEKGYTMLPSYAETYRTYSNNNTSPWVDADGNLNIDKAINDYIAQMKTYVEKGYALTAGIWDQGKTDQMYKDGKVMCFFGPAWYYNFCMTNAFDPSKGTFGDWAICEGPQAYFWGGTWLLAATGTDNQEFLIDIFNAFTENEDVLNSMIADQSQFVNHKELNAAKAADPTYGNDFLGGQNDTALFLEIADKIVFQYKTGYDQLLNENITRIFLDYFNGTVDEATAWNNFYTYVNQTYPAIKTPTV